MAKSVELVESSSAFLGENMEEREAVGPSAPSVSLVGSMESFTLEPDLQLEVCIM